MAPRLFGRKIRVRRAASLVWLATSGCGPEATPADIGGSTAATNTSDSASTSTTSTSSTSSTTTSESSADDPSVDEGGQCFFPHGDLNCAIECDLEQNCMDGQKCMPWAASDGVIWDGTKCVPVVAAPRGVGDLCAAEGAPTTGWDDCDVGLMCFGVDPATNEGRCVELCSSEVPSCATPNTICVEPIHDVFGACLEPCDPLDPTCASGYGCYAYVDAVFGCAPDGSGANGAYGDACLWPSDCEPGLACAGGLGLPECDGQGACCTTLCDPGAGELCPEKAAGQGCQPLAGDPEIGFCR